MSSRSDVEGVSHKDVGIFDERLAKAWLALHSSVGMPIDGTTGFAAVEFRTLFMTEILGGDASIESDASVLIARLQRQAADADLMRIVDDRLVAFTEELSLRRLLLNLAAEREKDLLRLKDELSKLRNERVNLVRHVAGLVSTLIAIEAKVRREVAGNYGTIERLVAEIYFTLLNAFMASREAETDLEDEIYHVARDLTDAKEVLTDVVQSPRLHTLSLSAVAGAIHDLLTKPKKKNRKGSKQRRREHEQKKPAPVSDQHQRYSSGPPIVDPPHPDAIGRHYRRSSSPPPGDSDKWPLGKWWE